MYMLLSSKYSDPKERYVVECRKQGVTYQQMTKECMILFVQFLVKYEVIEISGFWYEAVLRINEDAIGRSYPIEPWLLFYQDCLIRPRQHSLTCQRLVKCMHSHISI